GQRREHRLFRGHRNAGWGTESTPRLSHRHDRTRSIKSRRPMNPRTLLNFLRSKSGKLVLFGLIFSAALVVFGSLRSQRVAQQPVMMKPADLDLATNKSQTVESITRPMQ